MKKQQCKSNVFEDTEQKQVAANEGNWKKWAGNSKSMDATAIPLRLPKTELLSIFERDVRMIYVHI